jgi:hypothetical protein
MQYHAFMPEDWWSYVTRIAGIDATQKDIAEHTRIEQSTLSRWKLRKNPPNADAVIQFARSYRQNPVAALIAARYLRADEVDGVVEIATSASDLSIGELVNSLIAQFNELRRRVPQVGGIIDKAEDWPEGLFEGVSEKPPPVRRGKNS